MSSKVLIAYFGGYPLVRRAAQRMAALTGGDLYEIRAKTPYSDKPFTLQRELLSERHGRQTPLLQKAPPDLTVYEKIILCFPPASGGCPGIIHTFLRQSVLQEKTVYPVFAGYLLHPRSVRRKFQADAPDADIQPCRSIRTLDSVNQWLWA